MPKSHFRILIILSALFLGALAAKASDEPFLESVDGGDYVRLERGGISYEMYPGEFFEVGDLLDVGQGGCRIVIPGLAEVSVSENTKVQWLGSISGAPEFNVSEGMIWARVVKSDLPATPVAAPDSAVPERYKFTVRTRAAVLGVRGTEFTAQYINDASAFSTFEGEVTVAKDQATLWAGNGIERLHAEDRIVWGYNKPPSRDRFKLEEMRAQIRRAHPRIFRLRHQTPLTVRELRTFQKQLKRSSTGQTRIHKQKLRSVLDLADDQVDGIDRKNWRGVSPGESREQKREERQKVRQERREERKMNRAPQPRRNRR